MLLNILQCIGTSFNEYLSDANVKGRVEKPKCSLELLLSIKHISKRSREILYISSEMNILRLFGFPEIRKNYPEAMDSQLNTTKNQERKVG